VNPEDSTADPLTLPEPPDDSLVGTPARIPGSTRRTANLNMVWPGGFGTPMEIRGRARDLITPLEGDPVVVAEAEMIVDVGPDRTIASITAEPARPSIANLVGARGGSGLRGAVDAAVPGEREAATPLHFLLDDIAGASLVGGFAWSRWRPTMMMQPPQGANRPPQGTTDRLLANGRIICSGLRPGGYSSVKRAAGDMGHYIRRAGDIETLDDPWGWHHMEPPATDGATMRRRRRVDVVPRGATILVDAHFRDSCWDPDGTEVVVHEYSLEAEVERASGTLLRIAARPRVLPFPECPWAAPHAAKLVGLPIDTFRTNVQETLTELECCTHLNDMLRCLAEVPALADHVDAVGASRA
jgi:Protein of unknown function (DUF2889)